uniref:hypothetical protein n=1 Tax=Massilia oculi TaxID=945844 RepID=UPI0036D4364E
MQLHPLVCTAFNADFDGDQDGRPRAALAGSPAGSACVDDVHQQHPVAGQRRARSSCRPQDVVLGLYYMRPRPGEQEGRGHGVSPTPAK